MDAGTAAPTRAVTEWRLRSERTAGNAGAAQAVGSADYCVHLRRRHGHFDVHQYWGLWAVKNLFSRAPSGAPIGSRDWRPRARVTLLSAQVMTLEQTWHELSSWSIARPASHTGDEAPGMSEGATTCLFDASGQSMK